MARDGKSRGVVVGEGERISVMINEEDHLRVQVMQSGLSLREAWALIDALDVAMSKTNAMVLSLRVTRVDSNNGKSETLYAPQVVSRAQPLRPLAVLALSRFLQSTQDTPAISMR